MRIFWNICTVAGSGLLAAASMLLAEIVCIKLGFYGTWPPGPGPTSCHGGEFLPFECSGFPGAYLLTIVLDIPYFLVVNAFSVVTELRELIANGTVPRLGGWGVITVRVICTAWLVLGMVGLARMAWRLSHRVARLIGRQRA